MIIISAYQCHIVANNKQIGKKVVEFAQESLLPVIFNSSQFFQTPWNASMLGVFTAGYCLLMATVSAASESYGAVFVFGTLAIICLLITLVSCVENWNPLSWVSIFILLLLVLAFYIVAFGFVRESPEITSVSFALSLVVTFYLLIDTSSVMTRPNLQLESDEVVFAVLTLHLDGLIIISKEVATKCYCI
ncbi:uncharacterized protein LOC111269760 isoform X2 [Varroa jacobsoni]|uniref:uncharacterized protein LOC111269760 isoform X2 n=1 Tax=Varroa jacobsoni TaxID=62625 RepID=UPI000BF438DD|nr:uncharacterized protein LOC111269760 isoform X2 [Varroa jacobsoni]